VWCLLSQIFPGGGPCEAVWAAFPSSTVGPTCPRCPARFSRATKLCACRGWQRRGDFDLLLNGLALTGPASCDTCSVGHSRSGRGHPGRHLSQRVTRTDPRGPVRIPGEATLRRVRGPRTPGEGGEHGR